MSKTPQTDRAKVLAVVQKMSDKVTLDDVIDELFSLKLKRALEQADRGDVMDHDEFMDQLMDRYEKSPSGVDNRSTRRPAANRRPHRGGGQPKKRPRVRQSAKKVG